LTIASTINLLYVEKSLGTQGSVCLVTRDVFVRNLHRLPSMLAGNVETIPPRQFKLVWKGCIPACRAVVLTPVAGAGSSAVFNRDQAGRQHWGQECSSCHMAAMHTAGRGLQRNKVNLIDVRKQRLVSGLHDLPE